MRGLAEHLGLLVLQQRGAATALESDLVDLMREVRAMQSLTVDYYGNAPDAAAAAAAAAGSSSSSLDEGTSVVAVCQERALPPQKALRSALEAQRQGLLSGLEAVREVQLLLRSVAGSDPPVPSSPSSTAESRAKRAKGGEGWGEAATDVTTSAEVKSAVDSLETSLAEMLRRLQCYPCPAVSSCYAGGPKCAGADAGTSAPLLAAGAARVVVETREALRACAARAKDVSERFAGVVPPAVLARVADHLCFVDDRVGSVLDGSAAMRSWLLVGDGDGADVDDGESERPSDGPRKAAAEHASDVGRRLTDAVKAMLLSVQALCPRDGTSTSSSSQAGEAAASTAMAKGRYAAAAANAEGDVVASSGAANVPEEDEEDSWSTGTTLFEAHALAFEQARSIKLWRCAAAMASARVALEEFSEDEAVSLGVGSATAKEASVAFVRLCADVLGLAEQVLAAGKAVLVGMVALNKVSSC